MRTVRFGIIGCGLMGREFASITARWCHLLDMDVRPELVAVCDPNEALWKWYQTHFPSIRQATKDYTELLANDQVEAVYCAVPHNLHQRFYCDIIQAGKHLMGEKPFGIDKPANDAILECIKAHPNVFVRSTSHFPFYPAAQRIGDMIESGAFGRIIEVEAGFWHSSDLNPEKPINWKRRIATNGEYGCMGDLGMHVVHLPFRLGWRPRNVRALLSKIVHERPDGQGGMAPCETWDNATLACEVQTGAGDFPMLLSTKRIAPGHGNTWFIRVIGTEFSASFTTQNPKQFAMMPYAPGDEQAWRTVDLPYRSAYPTITGSIFEFGFTDAILQMWAAFCDELVNGPAMAQPFCCATPNEAHASHELFTAALQSQRTGQTVALP